MMHRKTDSRALAGQAGRFEMKSLLLSLLTTAA